LYGGGGADEGDEHAHRDAEEHRRQAEGAFARDAPHEACRAERAQSERGEPVGVRGRCHGIGRSPGMVKMTVPPHIEPTRPKTESRLVCVDDERTEMARTKKVQPRPSKRTNELRDEGCGGVGVVWMVGGVWCG